MAGGGGWRARRAAGPHASVPSLFIPHPLRHAPAHRPSPSAAHCPLRPPLPAAEATAGSSTGASASPLPAALTSRLSMTAEHAHPALDGTVYIPAAAATNWLPAGRAGVSRHRHRRVRRSGDTWCGGRHGQKGFVVASVCGGEGGIRDSGEPRGCLVMAHASALLRPSVGCGCRAVAMRFACIAIALQCWRHESWCRSISQGDRRGSAWFLNAPHRWVHHWQPPLDHPVSSPL